MQIIYIFEGVFAGGHQLTAENKVQALCHGL
jgi:hypothetical protein